MDECLLRYLDPDIFTLSGIFSPEECTELIVWGESLGFAPAFAKTADGPQMLPLVRNNDRANIDDPEFAASLWQRVRDYVPQERNGERATGLNERFRFYRYDPDQRFKPHKDGSVANANGENSRLTFLLYLNEGYEGGETIFREDSDSGGNTQTAETVVAGRTGMGLFFVHERRHEGALVRSGRKYVLRTDVMYSRC